MNRAAMPPDDKRARKPSAAKTPPKPIAEHGRALGKHGQGLDKHGDGLASHGQELAMKMQKQRELAQLMSNMQKAKTDLSNTTARNLR